MTMMSFTMNDFLAILPLIFIIAWACMLLLVHVFSKQTRVTFTLSLIGTLIGLLLTLLVGSHPKPVFNNMVVVDGFSVFLNSLFLISGFAGMALAYDYNRRMELHRGEYYILILFSISGMMLMAVASDLIVVFLALELLSLPLYVLAGFAQPKVESEEAALKYFLLGAFTGGFVVYGIALVFGAASTTALNGIVAAVSAGTADLTLMVIGAALILVGLGFKVAVVPFQMWTPDVYHGAPSAVTAFMAVGAKAAGFAALLRVFIVAFPALDFDLAPVLWVLSVLTMIIGNFVAIAQSNIKRLLAYSSIAHAGYIFMVLVPFGQETVAPDAVAAALFYLLAYALTNFGAWSVVIALERKEDKGLELQDYAGLGAKYPGLAAAMAVFMLSFTGVPPTLGFVGKFFLFRTVLQGGFIGLAIVGVVTSLVSAYYYLRILVIMYMQEGEPEVSGDGWLKLTTGVTAVGIVVLSLFAVPLFRWASEAVLMLF